MRGSPESNIRESSWKRLLLLVDEAYRSAHCNHRKQGSNILGVHFYTPIGSVHADRNRFVRPVTFIATVAEAEPHHEVAQRIIRSWADHRRQPITTLGVFFANGRWRIP